MNLIRSPGPRSTSIGEDLYYCDQLHHQSGTEWKELVTAVERVNESVNKKL